jgi:hypothetical protein
MSKNMVEPESIRQYSTAHAHCMLGSQGYTRALTRTSQRGREPIQTHVGTHAHAHTEICNNAFPRHQCFRDRALTLRYAYIACLIYPCINQAVFAHYFLMIPLFLSWIWNHYMYWSRQSHHPRHSNHNIRRNDATTNRLHLQGLLPIDHSV